MVVLRNEAMPPPITTTASAFDALVVELEQDVDVFSSRSLPRSLGRAEREVI
jgi:hypothetical protein